MIQSHTRTTRRRTTERRSLVVRLSLVAVCLIGISCDDDDGEALATGQPVEFEVEGLRTLIDRTGFSHGERLLVVGNFGPDLQGRLFWADSSGSPLADQVFPSIPRSNQFAACLSASNANVLFANDENGGTEIYEVQIREDQIVSDPPSEPTFDFTETLALTSIAGNSDDCGICTYDAASGVLTCRVGLDTQQQTVWNVGPLGNWTVQFSSLGLVLADWASDEGGQVTIRATLLPASDADEITWIHAYIVGTAPALGDAEPSPDTEPRFIVDGPNLLVFFIDGTQWFTRVFWQSFPMFEHQLPNQAVLLESCRGSCQIRWVGLYEGAVWIWYRDEFEQWAERIGSGEERGRLPISPSAAVTPIGGGLFKLGLGNELANWWELTVMEVDEE